MHKHEYRCIEICLSLVQEIQRCEVSAGPEYGASEEETQRKDQRRGLGALRSFRRLRTTQNVSVHPSAGHSFTQVHSNSEDAAMLRSIFVKLQVIRAVDRTKPGCPCLLGAVTREEDRNYSF